MSILDYLKRVFSTGGPVQKRYCGNKVVFSFPKENISIEVDSVNAPNGSKGVLYDCFRIPEFLQDPIYIVSCLSKRVFRRIPVGDFFTYGPYFIILTSVVIFQSRTSFPVFFQKNRLSAFFSCRSHQCQPSRYSK